MPPNPRCRPCAHPEQTTAAGVAGKADVQQVVQALSDAEVTMQTVVAVRDKVLGAYNDIMQMTV